MKRSGGASHRVCALYPAGASAQAHQHTLTTAGKQEARDLRRVRSYTFCVITQSHNHQDNVN